MTTTPARHAVYGEFMWPDWNPVSEKYGTGLEKANELLDAHAAEVRAAALTEAAGYLRDAHFRDGMSVQEIGTALRGTAAARPDDTQGA